MILLIWAFDFTVVPKSLEQQEHDVNFVRVNVESQFELINWGQGVISRQKFADAGSAHHAAVGDLQAALC